MANEAIIFQGDQGLLFSFDDALSLETQKEKLAEALKKFQTFLPGETLQVDMGSRRSRASEIEQMGAETGVPILFSGREEALEGVKFVFKTVRSGQEVKSQGHAVILGGVNPGGVVEAGGHVVVLGDLRGRVAAGLKRLDAKVFALKLAPERLEVAHIRYEGEPQSAPSVVTAKQGSCVLEPL